MFNALGVSTCRQKKKKKKQKKKKRKNAEAIRRPTDLERAERGRRMKRRFRAQCPVNGPTNS